MEDADTIRHIAHLGVRTRNYAYSVHGLDAPTEEFRLRAEVQSLSNFLVANGWVVLSISLQKLVLDRQTLPREWLGLGFTLAGIFLASLKGRPRPSAAQDGRA